MRYCCVGSDETLWWSPGETCYWGTMPGSHFTKGSWAHNPNLVRILVAITRKIMIRSGHNSAHVTTAELSWHVQICDLIESLELILQQRQFEQVFSYELASTLWNRPQVVNVLWTWEWQKWQTQYQVHFCIWQIKEKIGIPNCSKLHTYKISY